MELSLTDLMHKALFLEALTIVVSARIIWVQLLSGELRDYRAYPFVVYLPRRRSFRMAAILSQIDILRKTHSQQLQIITSDEKLLRELVLKYNVLQSESVFRELLLGVTMLVVVCLINPLLLVSGLVADLLTARIHHHITSSL